MWLLASRQAPARQPPASPSEAFHSLPWAVGTVDDCSVCHILHLRFEDTGIGGKETASPAGWPTSRLLPGWQLQRVKRGMGWSGWAVCCTVWQLALATHSTARAASWPRTSTGAAWRPLLSMGTHWSSLSIAQGRRCQPVTTSWDVPLKLVNLSPVARVGACTSGTPQWSPVTTSVCTIPVISGEPSRAAAPWGRS